MRCAPSGVNFTAVVVESFHGEDEGSRSTQLECSGGSVTSERLGGDHGVFLTGTFFHCRHIDTSDNSVLSCVGGQGPRDGDGRLIISGISLYSQIIDGVGWACEETAVFSPRYLVDSLSVRLSVNPSVGPSLITEFTTFPIDSNQITEVQVLNRKIEPSWINLDVHRCQNRKYQCFISPFPCLKCMKTSHAKSITSH